MADVEKNNVLLNNLATLSQPDNFQRYVLGTKSNGQPRALYDVVKDYTKPKKKKKKAAPQPSAYQLFLTSSKKKKKKKKKKKGKKRYDYWDL